MEDVAPRRRRAQRSPTPTKRKRSPHSPHRRESKREEKNSKKKKERKRSPSSPSSSPSSSSDEGSGYSSQERQRRGHRRSYAAWKRSSKLKKFKEGGKNISFLTYDGTFGATDKVLAFIQQFDAAFGDEGFTESSKLRHVAMHFQKSARQWWASLRANGEAPKSRHACGRQCLSSTKWTSYPLWNDVVGTIGMCPFKALYGQECIAPLNFSDPTVKVEASKQMLDEMEAQTKPIRKDIQAAQDRQKHYADKDRSERTFKLGDRVFLRVKPKQSYLSLGKLKKLSPRYCGPYEIVKVISDQAYKLRLPPNLKVHDVFYVSLLKPYVPNPDQILDAEQIVVPSQDILELQPDYILEMRERKLRNRSIIEHLVKWKDFPEEDATWEDEITLQKDYPDLSLR
ncbi:hypothetical protein L7F22_030908 [Adiantum nelumboides]|nr:hypothetical protein [Adiantum nelumboides]